MSKTLIIHDEGAGLDYPGQSIEVVSFDRQRVTKRNIEHANNCTRICATIAPELTTVCVSSSQKDEDGLCRSLIWAAKNGNVVLCPWGMNSYSYAVEKTMQELVEGEDVLFVCSVGNGQKVLFPAVLPSTLGIGAHSTEMLPVSFSAKGLGLDLLAPASEQVAIETNLLDASSCIQLDSWFVGTSVAASFAAAVVGKYWVRNPGMDARQIHRVFCESALPCRGYKANEWSRKTGWGIMTVKS